MNMSLVDRHVAGENADYLNRLRMAMIQHAIFLVFNSDDAGQVEAARATLDAPGHHAYRVGYWIISHPISANIESPDELEDDDLLTAVQTVWDAYHRIGGAPDEEPPAEE